MYVLNLRVLKMWVFVSVLRDVMFLFLTCYNDVNARISW